MRFYDWLLKKYGYNEPIFTSEIEFEDYSRPWIFKELNELCRKGLLARYDKGVCYIPKTTFLGKTLLDPRKVIAKKYISSNGDTVGYYSGNTLLNLMELSTQMSNSIEIYTNNEKTKIREIKIGSQKVILRRSRTKVTKENSAVMQLLELMNFTSAEFFDKERRKTVCRFIKEKNITRKMITEYAPFFPDKALRNLITSEVIYSVT